MDDPVKLALLRLQLKGLVRNIPADLLIEELANAFTEEVIRQIQPPNQPTLAECKALAHKDKLAFRLHQTLLRD